MPAPGPLPTTGTLYRALVIFRRLTKRNRLARTDKPESFESHESGRIGAGNLFHFLHAQAAFVQHAEIHAQQLRRIRTVGAEIIGAHDDLAQADFTKLLSQVR